jgi:hypothetical protein
MPRGRRPLVTDKVVNPNAPLGHGLGTLGFSYLGTWNAQVEGAHSETVDQGHRKDGCKLGADYIQISGESHLSDCAIVTNPSVFIRAAFARRSCFPSGVATGW